jgi:hypothetical protein
MRINRLVAGAVSAGLLGLTPIAIASPSSATENLTATVTATPSATQVTYGDDFYVSVDLVGSDGRSVSNGTSTLYAMEAGSAAWTPVATGQYASSSFYDVKPKANTSYKVVYNGYAATATYQNNYAAAESAPFTIGVARNVSIDNAKAKLTIKGKVKPDYKKKKVKITIKKGKKYVKYKTIKTDKKSKFQIRLPAPKRGNKLFFKITVPGDSKFLGYSEVWYTYTY